MIATNNTLKARAAQIIDSDDTFRAGESRSGDELKGTLRRFLNDIAPTVEQAHTELITFLDGFEDQKAQLLELLEIWEAEGEREAHENLKNQVSTLRNSIGTSHNSINNLSYNMKRDFIERIETARSNLKIDKLSTEDRILEVEEDIAEIDKKFNQYKAYEQEDLWAPVDLLQEEMDRRTSERNRLLQDKTDKINKKAEEEDELTLINIWLQRAAFFETTAEILEGVINDLEVGLGYTGTYGYNLENSINTRNPQAGALSFRSILNQLEKNVTSLRNATTISVSETA